MTLVGYLDKHSRLEWRQYINYKSDFPAQQNQKNQTKKKPNKKNKQIKNKTSQIKGRKKRRIWNSSFVEMLIMCYS